MQIGTSVLVLNTGVLLTLSLSFLSLHLSFDILARSWWQRWCTFTWRNNEIRSVVWLFMHQLTISKRFNTVPLKKPAGKKLLMNLGFHRRLLSSIRARLERKLCIIHI